IMGFIIMIDIISPNVQCEITQFSSIQQLNAYLEKFFATNQSITSKQWQNALPTSTERSQMKELIMDIFFAKDYSTQCSSSLFDKYDALRSYLNVTLFKDNFCVIHELIPVDNGTRFKRFWGYAIIANANFSERRALHHSAPHFHSDGDICNETAAIFERTSGRSLVVAGADRSAVIGEEINTCQPSTTLADVAHNNATMFHTICESLYEAAMKSSIEENVFIQWHGMAETSCSTVEAFVSAGADSSSSIYLDGNLPVNRIVHHFNTLMGGASTPASHTECHLLATTNTFGRYINGVPSDTVCYERANDTGIRGRFVHIEQKRAIRDNWDLWTKIINASFPVSSGSASHCVLTVSTAFAAGTIIILFFKRH
uniref:Uncharacterized protein n=2 Tax=Parascaris univalens TaxID=6257 RepID=A0A915B854_PARUN